MAIDLKKMKEKQDRANNRGRVDWFKPDENKQHTIRILPSSDGDPFKEYWFHYGMKGTNGKPASILCPRGNFGEDCPICDFVQTLFDDGSDESRKQAKSIMKKQRFYSPVIERGGSEAPHVWGYGKNVYKRLIGLVLDPDYGDITDLEDGCDLKIKKVQQANGFPATSVDPARKSSPLCDDKVCEEILEKMPDFENLFKTWTEEEIQAVLDFHMNGSEGNKEVEVGSAPDNSDLDKTLAALMDD